MNCSVQASDYSLKSAPQSMSYGKANAGILKVWGPSGAGLLFKNL